MNPAKFIPISQIIGLNPIMNESSELKELYYFILKRYISRVKWKAKFIKAEMKLYQQFLIPNGTTKTSVPLVIIQKNLSLIKKYKVNIIADLCAILGYEPEWCNSKKFLGVFKTVLRELQFNSNEAEQAELLIKIILRKFYKVTTSPTLIDKNVIHGIESNLDFVSRKPTSFLVTATMSAGKSTFINAIVGKEVNLSQNLACTSKIHNVVNKAYEDNLSYEYDFDIELNADKTILFIDNDKNNSNYITVGTHFTGPNLQTKRCIICDSPGVNSHENEEHKLITQKMLTSSKFKNIIYILNATQLGTNDDEQHLRFIKENLGHKKIIFILNKIDAFTEDDDVNNTINSHIKYLESMGFKSPIVCPVSAMAAVLAQKSLSGAQLSKLEKRQLDNYIIDFEQNNLSMFYKNNFEDLSLNSPENDEEILLHQCGIAYVEKIISKYC